MAPLRPDEPKPIPDESGFVAGKVGIVILEVSDPACSEIDETSEDESFSWLRGSGDGVKFGGNKDIGCVGFCAASLGACSGVNGDNPVFVRWNSVEVCGLVVFMRPSVVPESVSGSAGLFAASSNKVAAVEECNGDCEIDVDGIPRFIVAFASCGARVVDELLLETNCSRLD